MRNILVIDDHDLIYSGLKGFISNRFEIYLAKNLAEARLFLKENEPYALLIDISLGEESGFDLVQDIPESCLFFFLSMHRSSVYIKLAYDLGAQGYFLKDEPPDLLLEALDSPLRNPFWMSEIIQKEFQSFSENKETAYDTLSPREQQIFGLLAEGVGYREIAFRLKISAKTVNNHRDKIMIKLSLTNQTELVKFAYKIGAISLS
jgi:DNA-binding NarL/FixJ family response regulator